MVIPGGVEMLRPGIGAEKIERAKQPGDSDPVATVSRKYYH
jgi:hypothetical protein